MFSAAGGMVILKGDHVLGGMRNGQQRQRRDPFDSLRSLRVTDEVSRALSEL